MALRPPPGQIGIRYALPKQNNECPRSRPDAYKKQRQVPIQYKAHHHDHRALPKPQQSLLNQVPYKVNNLRSSVRGV